jgi:hypothetical protein
MASAASSASWRPLARLRDANAVRRPIGRQRERQPARPWRLATGRGWPPGVWLTCPRVVMTRQKQPRPKGNRQGDSDKGSDQPVGLQAHQRSLPEPECAARRDRCQRRTMPDVGKIASRTVTARAPRSLQ